MIIWAYLGLIIHTVQYWRNPGALARAGLVDNLHTDRFLAILSVIVQAAFSYQGMELVAM